MSNGVGLIAALSGSIPAPRRTPKPESGSRPTTRTVDRAEPARGRLRSGGETTRPQARVAPAAGKLPTSRGVVAAERRESMLLLKASASRAAASPLAASIERVRVVDPSRIRISLRPDGLGDVHIELAVSGSVLGARVVTSSEEARALIQGNLDELRDLLQGKGFRVREFRVVTAGAGPTDVPDEERPAGLRSHRRQVLDVRA